MIDTGFQQVDGIDETQSKSHLARIHSQQKEEEDYML